MTSDTEYDNVARLVDHLFCHETGKLIAVLTRILGPHNIEFFFHVEFSRNLFGPVPNVHLRRLTFHPQVSFYFFFELFSTEGL